MSVALALIGLGHIGGSMAYGLRAAGAAHAIYGYDADADALRLAQDMDLIDAAGDTPEAAIRDAELIVLATPPSAIAEICRQLEPHITPAQTVTDVGSVKEPVLRGIAQACGRIPAWFVPGHPIAGTEKSGAQHASGALFRDRYAVLTPTDATDPAKIAQVRWMWEQLGARLEQMDAAQHDALFAGVSHLPHVLAYALMNVLAEELSPDDMKRYAAGGLLDFTRIASSSPDLWVDICHANRDRLVPMLEQCRRHIQQLLEIMRDERTEPLRASFAAAKRIRDELNDPTS